jgi:hypothetical protein
MWQLWTAEQMGFDGYINWPQRHSRSLYALQDPAAFAQTPNMYDWYFTQPKIATPPPREKVWEWEHCPELGVHPFMSQPVEAIRAYYQENFKFNAAVNARGDGLVQKYGLNFDKLIGVSWRGTDSIIDGRPRLPIEVYFSFIDEILAQEPDLRIFATAEEDQVLEPLLKRYPQAFTIPEFFSAPHGARDNPDRTVPLSGYERGMCPALLVWILSKCKHYIKNRSSIGFVSSYLSNGNIICLAHPENSGYVFDLKTAEHKGKIVPMIFP